MITVFPKTECHKPKFFVIDAKNYCLGRVATQVSKLLQGKGTSYYTPGVFQGNVICVINAAQVRISGKKEFTKFYVRNSQRPGGLKLEAFHALKQRIPARILEKAIRGMLPKTALGRKFFKYLFVFSKHPIYKKGYSFKSCSFLPSWEYYQL